MFKVTIKNLLGHKLRVVITAIAIIAGVSFMSGTFILTDTIKSAFNDLFANTNKGVDAVVRQKSTFSLSDQGGGGGGGSGAQRDLVPTSLVDVARSVPGAAAADSSIFVANGAFAIGSNNKPINPLTGAPQFGANWQTVKEMNPFRIDAGRAPTNEREVAVDKLTAQRGNLSVNGPMRLQAANGPIRTVTVVGVVVTRDGAPSLAGASVVLMDTASASRLFGEAGKANSIIVHARSGVSQETLVQQLKAKIPSKDEAITGAAATKETQDAIQKSFQGFSIFLTVFAIISLVAGAFLIYNIFGIVVVQRTKELALLRAIGASRKQVRRSVLTEALVTGLVASALGLLAGILLAVGLTAALKAVGLDISASSIVIAPFTIIISLVVGVVVTMLSAYLPSRRASRVSPMAAIREVAVDDSGKSTSRLVIGGVFLAFGVLATLAGFTGKKALPIGLGALALFIAIVVLGPRLAPIIVRVVGAWLPSVKGLTGRLARDNAVRSPKRTASTATSLILALALVSILTIMLSSFTASINAAVSKGFIGDYQVSAGFSGATLSPDLRTKLEKLPQIGAVGGISVGAGSIFGKGVLVWGTDGPGLKQTLDLGVDQGDLAQLVGTDTIALDSGLAKLFNLPVGGSMALGFPSGEVKHFKVVATYTEAGLIGQGASAKFLLPRAAFSAFEPPQARADLRVLVKAAPGVSKADARRAVTLAIKQFPTAKVESLKEIQKSQTKQLNNVLSFMLVLLALTVFIGFLGIAITLALSVIERTHELGLLRAVGMDRRRMRSMVRWEAVLIALLGTILGLALGVVVGTALARAVEADIDTARLSFPITRLAFYAIFASVFGVLAAIFPARRAAKLDVLAAISTE